MYCPLYDDSAAIDDILNCQEVASYAIQRKNLHDQLKCIVSKKEFQVDRVSSILSLYYIPCNEINYGFPPRKSKFASGIIPGSMDQETFDKYTYFSLKLLSFNSQIEEESFVLYETLIFSTRLKRILATKNTSTLLSQIELMCKPIMPFNISNYIKIDTHNFHIPFDLLLSRIPSHVFEMKDGFYIIDYSRLPDLL